MCVMETFARFDSPEDAYLFRSFMASRGIGVSILDEHVPQWFWLYRNACGGTRVVLDDESEKEEAETVAKQYFAALRSDPTPVSQVRAWPLVLLLSLVMGLPMLIFGRRPVPEKTGD